MLAVLPFDPARGAEPVLGEMPDPEPGGGEVLLRVRATAVNRADLLQLAGRYPPPPGEPEVPGLECAGEVERLGPGVEGFREGALVMALLGGGGHGERVAVPAGQLLPLPAGWTFAEGAAIPEAALTAWTALVAAGRLQAGEAVLVSGATGGIGTFAVQLARELGGRVIAAGRDRRRLQPLLELGAEALCELAEGLAPAVRQATGGRGADLALDFVGGAHLPPMLAALAPRGRLVLLGLLAGSSAQLDLGLVLRRRLTLVGSVLRPRPREEKAALVAAFGAFAAGRLAGRRLRPVIDRVLPFSRIAEAYAQAARGGGFGKIVVALE